jgi:predicted ATPase
MIIELSIKNFKSIREETTVKFVSGKTSILSGNLLRQANGERIVKSMAIYGPNASGKTTVIDALYAIGSFVLFSSRDQKPTALIPHFRSFALDRLSKIQPSRVALTIDIDGERFTLDVSATRQRVWRELLTVRNTTKQPSRKASVKTLIERTWDEKSKSYVTTLHEDLGPELTRQAALEQTTANRLMVGKLASLNSELARRIFQWVEDDLDFYDMHRSPVSEQNMLSRAAGLLREDTAFAECVSRFLSDADIGITTFKVVEEATVRVVVSAKEQKPEFKSVNEPAFSFRHATQDKSVVFFRRQRESSGTIRFVALLAAILQPSARRRVVCIDELSASMHPELVRRLVKIVHSKRYNRLGNQLLFTTHDTHLMDPGELLRRDQVTICDKDRFGRTTTRRLDEFQDDARSDANLQRQYLQGRFGGIPQFGPTLEDVPLDDQPLEVNP